LLCWGSQFDGAIARRVRAEKNPLPPEEAVHCYKKWLGLLGQPVITLIPEGELLDQAVKLSVEIAFPPGLHVPGCGRWLGCPARDRR